MSQLSRKEIIGRADSGDGLRGLNLMRASLADADLRRADLSEANLRMANLERANLSEARLTGSHLSGAVLSEAQLAGANLVAASMIGAMLKAADLSRVDLSGADLTGATLVSAHLAGAYLVGAFLNETDLSGADLTGAYVRMAQMAGSNLSGAVLDGADLSQTDLSGVRLEGCSLVGANLTATNFSGSWIAGADLRDANLTGANLSGCNLTGAKLHGVTFERVCLDDAWAEWVDFSEEGSGEQRALLEEVFAGVLGKPMAQVIVEGRVDNEVWAELIAHLCEFQWTHPEQSDVRLRAIHQGVAASVLYLEADQEFSLAAYLAELADTIGNGSLELFERLAEVLSSISQRESSYCAEAPGTQPDGRQCAAFDDSQHQSRASLIHGIGSIERHHHTALIATSRAERLQRTDFWNREKAFAILTSRRRIWFEAASSDSLTLRLPRGSVAGLDLIRGRFVAK